MTQKKKLVLSPLPEQTDDYSRYEESETRWDRIIAFVVIMVLLIGAIIYFLVSNDEGDKTSELNAAVSEEFASGVKPEEISSSVVQDVKNLANELKQDPEKSLRNAEQIVEVDIAKPNEVPFSEKLSKPGAQRSVAEEHSASVQAESIVRETSVILATPARSAQIKIQNNAITRALLTLEIKDKEPKGSIPYELALPEEGITKVILFTEMKGLRGKKLYHEWYRNGVRQARVRIPVNVDKQQSHSSKYINTQMLGDWQVKVIDGQQNSYALAEFKVVLP